MASVLVMNPGGRLNLAAGVSLAPGLNEVDGEAWKACAAHPVTRTFLDRGKISITTGPQDVKAAAEPPLTEEPADLAPGPVPDEVTLPDLSAMKVREAKDWIHDCADPMLLGLLLDAEKRKSIRTTLENRLEDLDPPA